MHPKLDVLFRPAGPEPPAVYWRNRAIVLAGLVIVVVLVVMIIKALGGNGDASSGPTTSPPPAAVQPNPTEPETPPACTAQQLTGGAQAPDADISLVKDKEAFTTGEPVTFTATVKNTSGQDCSILNNAHNVVLAVESGNDRIFNSADCAAAVSAESGVAITIKAGAVGQIPISWDATRSQQSCREIKELPFRSKDATYNASVTIAEVASDKTWFLLTP
ncbi:MAG: hypothetical protein LBJ62_00390 [Bifidobacteriaceae bacterium]|jgi:uncharacterized repeat protein (TIGR01451 family)|nr:hypothetical protein [Bifidobacteriaceae bacterium]